MHVKRVVLRNFKRFADMTIEGVPATARLVIVTGPNGSGKSAIAEAFNYRRRAQAGFGINDDSRYFWKLSDEGVAPADNRVVEIEFHETQPESQDQWKRSIYLRS